MYFPLSSAGWNKKNQGEIDLQEGPIKHGFRRAERTCLDRPRAHLLLSLSSSFYGIKTCEPPEGSGEKYEERLTDFFFEAPTSSGAQSVGLPGPLLKKEIGEFVQQSKRRLLPPRFSPVGVIWQGLALIFSAQHFLLN